MRARVSLFLVGCSTNLLVDVGYLGGQPSLGFSQDVTFMYRWIGEGGVMEIQLPSGKWRDSTSEVT